MGTSQVLFSNPRCWWLGRQRDVRLWLAGKSLMLQSGLARGNARNKAISGREDSCSTFTARIPPLLAKSESCNCTVCLLQDEQGVQVLGPRGCGGQLGSV